MLKSILAASILLAGIAAVGVNAQDAPAISPPAAADGDMVVNGAVLEDWGLHLIDANLTMGNLLSIVGDETTAYLAKGKK